MSLALLITAALAAVSEPAPPLPLERVLENRTQALVDAVAPGNRSVWAETLHPHFLRMSENGDVSNRDQLLEEITPLPPGLVGSMKVENFRLSRSDRVAVAAYELQESLDYHGQGLRSRFRSLDTWQETPTGWKLLGQHVSAVLKDPPAVELKPEQLCSYSGTYRLAANIETRIECTADGIQSKRTDRKPVLYRAEFPDVFFVPGQPRTRRIFQRGPDGTVLGFADRREGEDVRWTKVAGR